MKTFQDIKLLFHEHLSGVFDTLEIDSFFYLTLEKFHDLKRIDLALQPEKEVPSEDINHWKKVLQALQSEQPIQYILGETFFYDLRFNVNEFTLIPRPETEELVAWILAEIKQKKIQNPTIIDIGTGSGCIPIALKKKLSSSTIFAVDISGEALTLAKENAELNQVEVHFWHKNILETENLHMQFDIIVSNPPYVRQYEKQEMKTNVLAYEPHLALFVSDENPLVFYQKIAELAMHHLTPNGLLFFEINQYLGNETIDLLARLGFNQIELRKDLYGNDRMIKAQLINE